ncbi:hypothetical protein GQ53DRAFT_881751 [Thozetella sp. PMI_491]|nr:hypothetical protein GQ53DRAFT_881751 [Thozetella sp. PMI_491]
MPSAWSHWSIFAFMAVLCPSRTVGQTFSLAAAGDLIGEIARSDDPNVEGVYDLVRKADFGFFNMEGNIFELATFSGHPASENGKENTYGGIGGGPQYEPGIAATLADLGFSLASHANNHAFDYAEAGMYATHQHLLEAGITYAGSGDSLQSARAAAFRKSGNVTLGLVCAAGTHTPESAAGAGSSTLNPRPGLSMLRATAVNLVTPEVFESIRAIAIAQGQASFLDDSTTDITLYTGQYPYAYSNFRLAEDGQMGFAWDMTAADRLGILDSIVAAKNQSDSVVFSIHGHESYYNSLDEVEENLPSAMIPADYLQNITRSAIDAGASTALVHGPHYPRAIEIYKGRPIFYGLGSLTWELGLSIQGFTLPTAWDDGILAVTDFVDGIVTQVAIYPLIHTQLTNSTDPDYALPKLARGDQAERILGYIRESSSHFGTNITIVDGVGYLELPNFACKKRSLH